MLSGLFTALTRETHFAVRRSALAVAAGVFLLLGLVALTAAFWLVVAERSGAVAAWLVLAVVYASIGLAIILWSRRAQRIHRLKVMARTSPLGHIGANSKTSMTAGLVEAFLLGLTAGLKK